MFRLAFSLPLLLASMPALAQSTRLPPAMIGTWAPELTDCADRDGVAPDSRVGVTAEGVDTFASSFTVRRWQRSGAAYRGRAVMRGEGEDGPEPGTVPVELRLGADGRLRARIIDQRQVLVRCPTGVFVR